MDDRMLSFVALPHESGVDRGNPVRDRQLAEPLPHPGVVVVPGVKVDRGRSTGVDDALTVEAPLQILINRRPFLVTMRTPGHDADLVRGLMFTEGVIGRNAPVRCRALPSRPGTEVDVMGVTIPEVYVCERWFSHRSTAANAACGICGQREMTAVRPAGDALTLREPVPADRLAGLPAAMRRRQTCFTRTGSSHAAAVFDGGGRLLAIREDVGRHNAVDKAIGKLLAAGRLPEARVLAVSGRISYEIVTKAFAASIPLVMGVSAPSSLAASLGNSCGMAILGYCRDGRVTVYSHPEYVGLPESGEGGPG